MLAAYAGFTAGAAYADLLAGYAYNVNQMTRQMTIPGLGARLAHGMTGAPQWFGQAEVGYRLGIDSTSASTLTPFARLEAATVSQAAFAEWGAGSLDLVVAGQSTSAQRSVLGAELAGAYRLAGLAPLGLQLRLGWAHDYADTSRPVTAALSAAPNAGFTVFGSSMPRDSVTVGLGLSTTIDDRYALFVRYDGEVAAGADSHALNAGIRFRW